MDKTRGNRRTVEGVVTSDKAQKTITVRVQRLVKVPKYGKYVRRHTVCHAHDERNEAHVGDRVELMATRPLSKSKCWRLVRVIRQAAGAVITAGAGETQQAPTPAE